MDVKQEVYNKFMKDHCERWLRDKIPALDGMTQWKPSRLKLAEKKVRNLLKLFENSEERNKSESQPTMIWLGCGNGLGLRGDKEKFCPCS